MEKKHIVSAFITKHITFYHLHFLYFISLSLLGAVALSSHSSISFIDGLFNAVSALTVTGLITVEMHCFTIFHDITLLILMVLGSHVFTSLLPLFLRRYSAKIQNRSGCSIPRSMYDEYLSSVMTCNDTKSEEVTQSERGTQDGKSPMDAHLPENATLKVTILEIKHEMVRYCEFGEREKIVSALFQQSNPEIEALAALLCVVISYFVAIHILGFIFCDLFFLTSHDALNVLQRHRKNHAFFSFFITISAFANAGFTLIDENMVPFQKSVILLLSLCLLILVGNTLFAPCLRLVIWCLYRCARGRKKIVYKYLLQNPRKCFTHLFSFKQTIWLVIIAIVLNTAQIICIYGLDWSSKAFDGLGAGDKIADGVFQSIATRNAGMNVITLSSLSSATLFLILGMMYVAVYPVSVVRRHSQENYPEGRKSNQNHYEDSIYGLCRSFLARDSIFLFIATFLIFVTESKQMRQDPLNFSLFNIVFEIIRLLDCWLESSGYGNVGLSLGYSCELRSSDTIFEYCENVHYSLSGKWTTEGKLILIVIMLLGRSRGLPQNIDSAIKLPMYKQSLEEEMKAIKLRRCKRGGAISVGCSRSMPLDEDCTTQSSEGHVLGNDVPAVDQSSINICKT